MIHYIQEVTKPTPAVCWNANQCCDEERCYCPNEEVVRGAKVQFVGTATELAEELDRLKGVQK